MAALSRERSVGKWEGLHHDKVQAHWPGTFLPDGSLDPLREPPGGENLQQFAGRVEAFLVWLNDRDDAEAGDVYLVTHNGWIRVALWLAGHVSLSALFRQSVPFLTPIDLAG
jgi:broad specificity phosphatase PhoE